MSSNQPSDKKDQASITGAFVNTQGPMPIKPFSATGKFRQFDASITQRHAAIVKNVYSGGDIVENINKEKKHSSSIQQKTGLENKELLFINSWFNREIKSSSSYATKPVTNPIISYPKMWNTNRGRYCLFKAPCAGHYGLLRARVTY